ncbi:MULTISPECIES: hypothetical protein [unclassified Sphingomonas]|nr:MULTISPECIES: hypothetical protein [unclassified Sphingomonas]
MINRAVKLDRLAEVLAAEAGVVWRDLSDYPGYLKGRWRDQGRSVAGQSSAGVRFIEGRPQWDGSTSDELVCDLPENFLTLAGLKEIS